METVRTQNILHIKNYFSTQKYFTLLLEIDNQHKITKYRKKNRLIKKFAWKKAKNND